MEIAIQIALLGAVAVLFWLIGAEMAIKRSVKQRFPSANELADAFNARLGPAVMERHRGKVTNVTLRSTAELIYENATTDEDLTRVISIVAAEDRELAAKVSVLQQAVRNMENA